MMNGKSNRILVTWVLAAVIATALGSEAFAASWTRTSSGVTTARSTTLKPQHGPFSGEPDAGGGSAPQPPKAGASRTGGGDVVVYTWLQRIQWSLRVWLEQLPKRYP